MESSTLAARELADDCPIDGEVKLTETAIPQNSAKSRARRVVCDFMANEYTQTVVYTARDSGSVHTPAAGT